MDIVYGEFIAYLIINYLHPISELASAYPKYEFRRFICFEAENYLDLEQSNFKYGFLACPPG